MSNEVFSEENLQYFRRRRLNVNVRRREKNSKRDFKIKREKEVRKRKGNKQLSRPYLSEKKKNYTKGVC
jgi:hypothetical protein